MLAVSERNLDVRQQILGMHLLTIIAITTTKSCMNQFEVTNLINMAVADAIPIQSARCHLVPPDIEPHVSIQKHACSMLSQAPWISHSFQTPC